MTEQHYAFHHIPAVLFGEMSDRVWLYIHGKCGCKEEAGAFAETACSKGAQVLAVDLPEHGERQGLPGTFTPWDVIPEMKLLLNYARTRWKHIALRCTSLGAWFSLLAFGGEKLDKALFVSPVLDMERLIRDMMGWAEVSEERLRSEGKIPTSFGETLSWRYFQYAIRHPVTSWNTPTAILYAGRDSLTGRETVDGFVRRFGCELTVLENGEHWFHTPEQLLELKRWEEAHT